MAKTKKLSKKKRDSSRTARAAAQKLTIVPSIRSNPVHSFRRAVTRQFSWNPAIGIDGYPYQTMQVTFAPGGVNFRIAGTSIYTDPVPNATEFTNLYDQWRLKDIIFRFDCTVNTYANSGVTHVPPMISYVADYDDPNDTTATDILQYPQMAIHSFTKGGYQPLILKMQPRVLDTVATSGFLLAFGPSAENPWIRTAEFSSPHYGLKFVFSANGASANVVTAFLQATVWLDFECTNPK